MGSDWGDNWSSRYARRGACEASDRLCRGEVSGGKEQVCKKIKKLTSAFVRSFEEKEQKEKT